MKRLGYKKPAVAALCAIETVNPNMSETIDAQVLKKMVAAGIIGDCEFEGPISYDVAMMPEAARIKGYNSLNSGNFDVFLVPNLLAGNLLGKSLVYTLKGKMAGLILGAKVPIVLTSRSSTSEENIIHLPLRQVYQQETKRNETVNDRERSHCKEHMRRVYDLRRHILEHPAPRYWRILRCIKMILSPSGL